MNVEKIGISNINQNINVNEPFKEFLPIYSPIIPSGDTFAPSYKINSTYGNSFTGTKQEIENKVDEVITRGCEMYGIPEELKPNFVVVDKLQYETQDEVNKRINSDNEEIFKDAPKALKDMSDKEMKKFLSTHTDLKKEDIDNIIMGGNGKDKGFYSPINHTITYYTQGYREGKESIEGTILHELYHVKEAIARSSLSQESRDEIVKNELLSRIDWGETRSAFKQFPQDNDISTAMMNVPILDDKTKKSFKALAQEDLFTADWTMYEKLQRYTELLEQDNPDKEELEVTRNELGDFPDKLEEIAKNGKIYDSSSLWLSKKDKTLLLMNYALSVEFRYQYFREQELKDVPVSDTNEDKKLAQESIRGYIDSTQANFALTISRQQKNKRTGDEIYWQYYTSREEVNARLYSEVLEIEILEEQRKTALHNEDIKTAKSIKKQLKEKKSKYKEDKIYIDFYQAEDNFRANPKNLKNKINYIIMQQQVQNKKAFSIPKTSLIFMLYSAGLVSAAISQNPQLKNALRRVG